MSETNFDNVRATNANAKVSAAFPATPEAYYGTTEGKHPTDLEWVGGELLYLTTDNKLYMNIATSGETATWARLADAFGTSTTSSTSTSSSSTTSTSTSTSSSTSTSTSTSSTTTA